MLRRSFPLLALAAALAAPAGAQAELQRFEARDAGAQSPAKVLRKAEAVASGRGARSGRELTPLLKELAVALPGLEAAERRRARRLLARPTLGEASANEQSYTVAEQPALCTAHFCVHWVATTPDAPDLTDSDGDGFPDYVETMATEFERVYDVENVGLGWRPPTSDGARGCPGQDASCMNRTDVYIADVGGQSIYGYAGPDPGQRSLSQAAFLVMDDDYSADQFPKYGGDALAPLRVTAAHEYNHVLQFGYDVAQDTWMLESTAVWMEEKVYPEVDDYLQYLGPWSQMSFVPLTYFNAGDSSDPANLKAYGDVVWNSWLERHHGERTIRRAWEHSLLSDPKSFAPGAYDGALRETGSTFYDSFTRFAADTAEWRAGNSPFPEGAAFPDMLRVRDTRTGVPIRLAADDGGAGGELPHTTFGLLDVLPTPAARIKLVFSAPRGVRGALALVGRTGDERGGQATVAITRLPDGGTGTVTLDDPSRFARVTAVIVNGDARTTGRFSRTFQDWEWTGDRADVTARISTDFTGPAVRRRSPRQNARRVSRKPVLQLAFSEPMMGIDTGSVTLIGPGGRTLAARISQRNGDRGLQIRPQHRLRAGRRYRVRLSADVTDRGGNLLAKPARKWAFRTRHKPAARR
jgi:hypothetical protein